MKTKIKIKGKDYPLAFSLYFSSEFEDDSGVSLQEVDKLPKSKYSKVILKMIYWALKDGARLEKKELDMDYYDILDAVENDITIVNSFNDLLTKRASEKKEEATLKS